MDDPTDSEAATLRWQCRRGMLELDYVLERYLDRHYAAAGSAEKGLFKDLLTAQDPELQGWLLYGVPHPDPKFRSLISKIRGI